MAISAIKLAQQHSIKLLCIGLGAIALLLILSSSALACGGYSFATGNWTLILFALPLHIIFSIANGTTWLSIPLLIIVLIEIAILKWKESLPVKQVLLLIILANFFYLIALLINGILVLILPLDLITPLVAASLFRSVYPRRKWLQFFPVWSYPLVLGLVFGGMSFTYFLCSTLSAWEHARWGGGLLLPIATIAAMTGSGIFFSWLTKSYALRLTLRQRPDLVRTVTTMHLGTLWIWPIAFYLMQARL